MFYSFYSAVSDNREHYSFTHLSYSIFHPLEVASRYCDQKLQVSENYSQMFNFPPNICNSDFFVWKPKGFFQFEITINVLVSSFCLLFKNRYVMGLRPLEIFYFFQCGDRIYTSESDVYRHQILTSKYGPRTERVNALPNLAVVVIQLQPIKRI